MINEGRLTFLTATRSITWDNCLNGLSKMSALTSYEYMSANMIAHNAPMLRPHKVTLPTLMCFLVYYSMSLMSNTSFTPYVKLSESLLPQPRKSYATKFILCSAMYGTMAKTSNFDPPLPCKYNIVSSVSKSGDEKMNPDNFLSFRFLNSMSYRTTLMLFMIRFLGPYELIFVFIWIGRIMLCHAC